MVIGGWLFGTMAVVGHWVGRLAHAQLSHVLHPGGEPTKPALSAHTTNSIDVSWRHVSRV